MITFFLHVSIADRNVTSRFIGLRSWSLRDNASFLCVFILQTMFADCGKYWQN